MCYPVWSKAAGSDSRLITEIDIVDLLPYHHCSYEECMMFFNTTTRTSLYLAEYASLGLTAKQDYDACYDCMADLSVLERYATKFLNLSAFQAIAKRVCDYFQTIPHFPDWYKGNVDGDKFKA
jgi:hypothetical protein